MRLSRIIKHRIRSLFRRTKVEDELRRELSLHLEQLTSEYAASGLSKPEARMAARRVFGSMDLAEEQCRETRRVHFLEDLVKDVAYSLRLLKNSRGFTLTALLSLALGIGVNTAIFTLIDAALLRSLPFREPDHLVYVWETRPQMDFAQMEASYPDFEDWIRQNEVFAGLAGYNATNLTVTGAGNPLRISGTRVTSNFFSILGVEPWLGRDFRPEEEYSSQVVILDQGFWQTEFGGSAEILGKSLRLNGIPHTIIGVLPAGFHFALNTSQVWLPLDASPDDMSRRSFHWVKPIGRLAASTSMARAQAEMSAIAARLAREHPETNAGVGIHLVSLREQVVGKIEPVMLVLLGAVILVLLITCANLANLLLARASTREREFAIRTALGAGHGRLVRQLFTEAIILSVLGGAAALVLSGWGLDLLLAYMKGTPLSNIFYLQHVPIDSRVLGFNLALTLITALVFGLAPAWHSTRVTPANSLREGARTSQGHRTKRLRQCLVVSEVAFTLVLLIGTGLIIKSLRHLLDVNPGFNASDLISMRLSLPAKDYARNTQIISFYDELHRRAASIPGVQSAAVIDELPLKEGDGRTVHLSVAGRPEPPPGNEQESVARTAWPSYFETMRIPLRAGRFFQEQDNAQAPGVVVLSQTLARRLFPEENPVGRSIILTFNRSLWRVIGVAADVKMADLEKTVRPALYTCGLQDPSRSANLVLRTALNVDTVADQIRAQVRSLDPELPVYAVRSMDEVINNNASIFVRRLVAFLLSTFGILSLVLATIGIYGVINYTVAQRTREFGIRVALGAGRGEIIRLVLEQGLWLCVAGVSLGLAAAAALTRTMTNLLFGVSPMDPGTFIAITGIVTAVAALASYLPARRAAALNPIVALHSE